MIFSPYEEYHQTRPFDEIYRYSGWIKCGHKMVHRHFSKQVTRQYGRMQTISRHPSFIPDINVFHIDQVFHFFLLHDIQEDEHGLFPYTQQRHIEDYISWFYRVSHPKLVLNSRENHIGRQMWRS